MDDGMTLWPMDRRAMPGWTGLLLASQATRGDAAAGFGEAPGDAHGRARVTSAGRRTVTVRAPAGHVIDAVSRHGRPLPARTGAATVEVAIPAGVTVDVTMRRSA